MSDQSAIQDVERAIWGQDPGALLRLPLIPPESWPGSVQQDCRAFGLNAPLHHPAAALPANSGIAVVMMVKDEADIIGHNLAWLHFIGVRRFVISDNGSVDGTGAAIEAFRTQHDEAEVVVIADPLVSYVQSLKTTGMLRYALSIWPDLRCVFPLDADEFLIPSQGFGVLDGLPSSVEVITIPKVIHFRHRLGGEADTGSPLGAMALRSPLFCVPPKCACRAGLHLTITGGNHHIRRMDGHTPGHRGGLSLGFYYREFQTRSFEHFLTKVRNGGKAILAAKAEGRVEGGEHWLRWFDVLQAQGEAGLRATYEGECVRGADPNFVLDPFHGVAGA